MPKYDWPSAPGQKRLRSKPRKRTESRRDRVSLDLTDPDKLRSSLRGLVGEVVADVLAEQLKQNQNDLGIDKIDRRYLRIPDADNAGTDGLDAADHVQFKFSVADALDRTGWSIDSIRPRRLHLLGGYFRSVLFGVPFKRSIAKDLPNNLVRVLSTEDPEGGYLIPPGFIPELVRDVPKLSALYQYVRRIPVPQNSGTMPKVGTNARVFWGTENQKFQEGDPAFLEEEYNIHRMNALVMLSREVASDTNPDIVTTVISLFQEAIAEEKDKVIAIGSGTGRPLGLYSAAAITDVDTITALDYEAFNRLKFSVDVRYHNDPSFRWTMNQNVLAAAMEIYDLQNRPIFRDAMAGEPATILGKPFSIENSLPNNYLGIGALRYYIWFDRQQLGVEQTTEGGTSFENHQRWIKFWERADGKPVLPPTKPMARARLIAGVPDLGT